MQQTESFKAGERTQIKPGQYEDGYGDIKTVADCYFQRRVYSREMDGASASMPATVFNAWLTACEAAFNSAINKAEGRE